MTVLGRALLVATGLWCACSPVQRGQGNPGPGGDGGPVIIGDNTADGGPGNSNAGDGGNKYQNVGVDGGCDGGTGTACGSPIAANAGCGAVELCGANGAGNGLDDNCDGLVDEICVCRPGDVESCFLGPPGKHGVGACSDGTQTCESSGEFGVWGKCQGSIGPHAESCDNLDNDCNGCADDSLCCAPLLDCPAPGDPRIADQPPYTDVALPGGQFFSDQAQSWSWTIDGGPCDRLFKTTTGSPPVQSFTLTGAHSENASVHYTLSGDYTVTMTVVDKQGMSQSCTWVQHIVGPGLRFELCWDQTGSVDLDLHVHQPGNTTGWFSSTADCYYDDCAAWDYNGLMSKWGYSISPIAECIGSPDGPDWQANLMGCANPRLDIDDIADVGVPENINIDKPQNGQTFRAMVHDYAQSGIKGDQHPLVNVYCAGKLMATYGQSPNQLVGFNKGGGDSKGSMWRVADVTVATDASGNTTSCTVNALHPANMTTGYWTTVDDPTY